MQRQHGGRLCALFLLSPCLSRRGAERVLLAVGYSQLREQGCSTPFGDAEVRPQLASLGWGELRAESPEVGAHMFSLRIFPGRVAVVCSAVFSLLFCLSLETPPRSLHGHHWAVSTWLDPAAVGGRVRCFWPCCAGWEGQARSWGSWGPGTH